MPTNLPQMRPKTAPVGGRISGSVSSFYGNDLAPGSVTGDSAGRYTYDLAKTYGPGKDKAGAAGSRPGTASQRRRYFFPQQIVQTAPKTKKQIPFYQYYDVLIEKNKPKKKDSNAAFSFNAKDRGSDKFYYRDFAQSDVEHYAQNREAAPLKVDVEELREWLVTARPRSSTDAGPMLILCQNIMKSLLDEKAIVFEKRAQAEKEEKEKAVENMSKRINELEAELKHARNRCTLAENKATELKQKLNASLDANDNMERELEQQKEIIKIKDKQGAQFETAGVKLAAERDNFTKQIDGLRDGASVAIRELRPTLLCAQEGALLCSAMDIIDRTHYPKLTPHALAEMLPHDPEAFKLPNAPAHDLKPLKLEARIRTMNEVISALTSKLLQTTANLDTANAKIANAEKAKIDLGLPPLMADPAFTGPRDKLLAVREQIRDLRNFTVEPKHPQVVRAFLLLIGTPKKKLDKWKDMKNLLGPEIFKGVVDLDTSDKKFEVLLQDVKTIVEGIDREDVIQNSEAVGCLLRVIEGVIQAHDNSIKKIQEQEKKEKEKAEKAAAAKAAAAANEEE